jgi:four helix bundle protein
MKNKNYIPLEKLEVYQLARELSRTGWKIYEQLNWQDKKIIGDQFITTTDSYGANLTEGYLRHHFLDKIKFYYNARASLKEAGGYWIELLKERGKVREDDYQKYVRTYQDVSVKFQNFITATYKAKTNYEFHSQSE